MAIPSAYERITYIESTGTQYIDTGVSPATYLNTLRIEADMAYTSVPTGSSTQSHLFGCGYYNSSGSNRRNILAGYRGATSTSLFSYLNGGQTSNAVAFTGATLDTNRHTFTIDQVNRVYGFDSNTQTFTTTVNANLTATLKIFCAHQSGTSGNPIGYYSSARLYGFKIYNNGTLIRDFIPVIRKSDNVAGLYDDVQHALYLNQGTGTFAVPYHITVTSSNEYGFATGGGWYVPNGIARLKAKAFVGYRFSKWTDGNTSNPREVTVTGDASYTAEFVEQKGDDVHDYYLWAKKRDALRSLPTFHTPVLSATISEDLLQKATSTIVCRDDATYLEEGDVVCLYDDKGKTIYNGVVSSVDGNTLTCGQMQSFYNCNFYAMTDTSAEQGFYSPYKASRKLMRYFSAVETGYMTSRETISGNVSSHSFVADTKLLADMNGIFSFAGNLLNDPVAPYQTSNETINLEELVYSTYSQYNLLTYFIVLQQAHVGQKSNVLADQNKCMVFDADKGFQISGARYLIPPYHQISISNNAEFVKDINVVSEVEDANDLYIFDSTGNTFRGAYTVLTDGTYAAIPTASVLRYQPIRAKFVTSDADLNDVINAELKLNQYNHKVAFSVLFDNNFYDFDDFKLGQRISFYVGDKLYNSVLTGWQYSIESHKKLTTVQMTCGKVRNNLTSKLNMGKVK